MAVSERDKQVIDIYAKALAEAYVAAGWQISGESRDRLGVLLSDTPPGGDEPGDGQPGEAA